MHVRREGYTLVELIFVLFVAGIVMGQAFPAVADGIRRVHLDGAARQLAADLHRARMEAVKRNEVTEVVRLGPSTYGITFVGSRSLPEDVHLTAGPDTVRFAPFGPTLTGPDDFVLGLGGEERVVSVEASGFARVR